jgi:type I restriction-modification system DNA methylase subunit
MSIKELVQRYEADRGFYLTDKYNETLLRSDFLDTFFELLGWDIKNRGGRSTNEREVILEEPLKANASESSKKPDYTFRLYAERKFFVEAKKPHVSIESNSESAKQVRRYGFTAKLKISALSNFEHLIIYDTSVPVDQNDTYLKALVKKYHYTEYEEKFDEIRRLLGRESVYSGQFEIEWKDIETKINQYSIDDLFLQQINEWRKMLGNEIFKHVPDINEQQLNDIVQNYLNRILFLRVCEDRNLETYQTLLKYAHENNFAALIKKFRQADTVYNSGLFEQLLADEIIENISSVFWTIIKQLYYPESAYSFAVFSSDILGNIYEIFLSEKLAIQNGEIVLKRKPEHLDRDIITTPTFIINDILRQTVLPQVEGKTDVEIVGLKCADIACGSGAFLLEVYQLLNDLLIDFYLRTDKTRLIQTNINTYKLPFHLKKGLLLDCIYGVDKDYNAVEATKFGLLLKLLENEDINTAGEKRPILPDLAENIFFGNSLITSEQAGDVAGINPFDFEDLNFDVIVGNPPYMKSEDMKNITPAELPIYKQSYTSAYKQFDKYYLFIERALDLIADDGILGYIVPSKFMKVGAARKIREMLAANGYLRSIISFGANQIFADKTTYTCLLILGKQPQPTFQFAEVKSLAKWKVRNPDEFNFATENTADLDGEVWALVPPELIDAYNQILEQSVRLVDLVGDDNIFNGIQTSANEIYIFMPTGEDDEYYYFSKRNVDYRIEKAFTKPYFKTAAGVNNLNTYRTFKPNARVIYPYRITENGAELVALTDIRADYPAAYEYLQIHREFLDNPKRDIKPEPETGDEWHRYGRHQSLDNCGLPEKIIVGVLSVGEKYAVDTHGTLVSSGGTAGYCVVALPEDSNYSIYYLQAVLNSKYLEWFSALYGEVFRGGYIARGTKVLKNLPIRGIDFADQRERQLHDRIADQQRELIRIFDRMDRAAGDQRLLIQLRRQFRNGKRDLEDYLAELYDLGGNDALIPSIKELYAAN